MSHKHTIREGVERALSIIAVMLIAFTVACGHITHASTHSPAHQQSGAQTKDSSHSEQHNTPDWESFLLLGLDQRGHETPRSDTMIVVNWDKVNNVVNVVSVPRDLWVNIPGYGWYKLGSAYSLGEGPNGPGGAQLVEKTLESNLGITIDHYAAVSLESFRSVVNHLGGIWVDVPYPLVDNEYPTDNYQYQRIFIQTGLQHMDGATALQYARSRHEDSDFGRSARQEEVLMAIRSQVANTSSVAKIPSLIGDLRKYVKTDLSTPEMVKLAPSGMKVNRESIHMYTMDYNVLMNGQSNDGQSILVPQNYDWAKFRRTVRGMLTREG